MPAVAQGLAMSSSEPTPQQTSDTEVTILRIEHAGTGLYRVYTWSKHSGNKTITVPSSAITWLGVQIAAAAVEILFGGAVHSATGKAITGG